MKTRIRAVSGGGPEKYASKQKVALDTNLGHKKMISRKITSDEFRTHPAFKKMWDATNATQGIHWVGRKYYTIREMDGKQYFLFEDCIVLAWRFNQLYKIPLELEARMRAIMSWESNYMAIATATKGGDPLDVAILKLCAENEAHNDAVKYGV